jgi:hypothetical protein
MARAGFPISAWKLGDPAVSANPSGYAIETPIARNPADQGNGVVIFAETQGYWHVVAQGSALRSPVPGVPARVLKALLDVPNEGDIPAPPGSTPTTGPLAKEPKIAVPTDPPPTSLVETNLVTGTGATASVDDTVTVNYVGALYSDGKTFDSSWERRQPLTAVLDASLIAGWVQGIPGMRVGGRRELIIPPSLAYGAHGERPTIPPNATLIYVIDLLAVNH